MKTELKPCPFCGKEACIIQSGDGVGLTYPGRPYVYIPTCKDSYCLGRNLKKHYNSREEALEKWNNRPLEKGIIDDWHIKEMPKEKGDYLCTVFGNSEMENFIVPCVWQNRPYSREPRFYCTSECWKDEDITNYVIAWIKVPSAYNKTYNPILRKDEDAWVSQHL